MEGEVKFFNVEKGFGFINTDEGKDVFVHISAVPHGITLKERDRVTFDVEKSDRGLKAINLQLD